MEGSDDMKARDGMERSGWHGRSDDMNARDDMERSGWHGTLGAARNARSFRNSGSFQIH
jgi:hypothetical protein